MRLSRKVYVKQEHSAISDIWTTQHTQKGGRCACFAFNSVDVAVATTILLPPLRSNCIVVVILLFFPRFFRQFPRLNTPNRSMLYAIEKRRKQQNEIKNTETLPKRNREAYCSCVCAIRCSTPDVLHKYKSM